MLKITFRHLEVFVQTVQKGSVTQAAVQLGLTQSAASMALGDFENLVGTKLFDRAGKRLFINGDGRALYTKAVEMLERAKEAETLFQRDQRTIDLRLGASSTIGNYLLPQLIGRYSPNHPDSQIRLHVTNTRGVIEAVKNFELDIGFVEGPCFEPEIEASSWRTDELAICVAPGDPLALGEIADRDSLRNARWMLRERGSGTREVVEQMLQSQLGPIKLTMELGGTEAIKRAVESGMGISCLPKIALVDAVAKGSLVILATPYLQLTRHFQILLHRDKYKTRGMLDFLDFCFRCDA
jgi:DNA-binding transcriptional LysR family regulator